MDIISGIYKITNKINGKIYIGQSKNIYARWKEHISDAKECKYPIQKALYKYGKDNFNFEIICICSIDELNEKEMYYINLLNANQKEIGYNLTIGGENFPNTTIGENNCNAKMSYNQIYEIRKRYNQKENKYDVYNDYKDLISFNTFCDIWIGKTWNYILPEVYTDENKNYHKNDRRYSTPNISEKDVLDIRTERNKGLLSKAKIYSFYTYINVNTFNDIWYDKTYKYIQPDIPNSHIKHKRNVNQNGTNNPTSKYTNDDVLLIRSLRDLGYKPMEIYKTYNFQNKSCFESFMRIWKNKSYVDIIPICND